MNEDFLNYMLEQENAPLLKGKTSKLLHDSPEGGTKTFGFGHKLTAEEQRTGKINGKFIKHMTRDDAIALFREDLAKASERAKAKLAAGVKSDKYGVVKADWDKLTDRQKAMLVDFEFNVKNGIKAFPSFTYGVVNNNQDIMREEYKRSFTDTKGRTRELARNKAFADLFFAPPIQAAADPEAQFMQSPNERRQLDFETGLQKPTNDLFTNPLLQSGGLVSADDPEAQTFMEMSPTPMRSPMPAPKAAPAPMQRSLQPLQNVQSYDNRVTEVTIPTPTSFMGTPLPQAPVPTPEVIPKNVWRDAEGNPWRDASGNYIYSGPY